MENPSKIVENGVVYSLGDFDGTTVHYDFYQILHYLEMKGKLLFGERFKIYKKDRPLIRKLCAFMIRDYNACKRYGLDCRKGILLTGPVGCGKTSLMKLVRYIVPGKLTYEMIPTRNVIFSFNHLGFKTVQEYGDSGSYCFDDLGLEPLGRFYGDNANVMGEVLLSRYELHQKSDHRLKTHATTNLSATELEDRYGQRVRSRMRALFNLMAFDSNSPDKRH
ncbi:P-loop NTPase family protein [Zunongwangia atlantica]|uniref:ATPase n=1 Tax=Zunongwangia atlantica 22II14-10F7 TaxID=1185767 RepID=A0A1Y1SY99_9FLAO|nr:ATPase [Zunongwangia atlantica]ORL43542.1 ATPase [Zunongwangia atlantica 22II14-10F7]